MIGNIVIGKLGLRKRFHKLFHKFFMLGIEGMGYGDPIKWGVSPLESKALKDSISDKSSPVIFDIGANRGDYVEEIIEKYEPLKPVIYAFEPDKLNADKVQDKWGYYPYLQIIRKCAGERQETMKFYHHAKSELSSLYYPDDKEADFRMATLEQVEEIEVVSLDDFCNDHNVQQIDFLKVDTEGHDLFVLKGASRMMKEKRIKNIVFEFSDMNIMSRTPFYDFWLLLHKDYTIYRMYLDEFLPIHEYNPLTCEIYHPINFFASLK